MDNPELREFIDAPREQIDVEYKAWLNLSDNEVRAKLAKHLCALANSGGGYLIFGINDDMTPAEPYPEDISSYNQDTLSEIIERYLKPEFQVTVHKVKSVLTETVYPIVWVPSHEAVPVCATRSGPHSNGKPVGITQSTYYTRAPGPKSVPITTPELWMPIIRRCVLRERQALLAGLESLLRPDGGPAPTTDQGAPLQLWHEAGHQRFCSLAEASPLAEQLKRAHYQFSYQLNVANGQTLDMAALPEHLRHMARETKDLVDTGWTMFWVFDGQELAPHSVTDPTLGDAEFLECNLIRMAEAKLGVADFWRIDPAGRATIIRPYREDHQNWGQGYEAGTWFSPYIMAREIAEVLRHARAFSERFETPESVTFHAKWCGLQDRVPKNHLGLPFCWMDSRVQSDDRTVTRVIPISHLTSHWMDITADILSTITRMFDADFSISSQEVSAWEKRFRSYT